MDELSLAREDYRRMEQKAAKLYKCQQTIVLAFAALMGVLTCIEFHFFYNNWIDTGVDCLLLCMNGVVLRASISQNVTFFHKLYRHHRYEFDRHIYRESIK